MYPWRLRFISLVLSAVVLLVILPPTFTKAQFSQRCFFETGFCISGRMREFWEQNGGLAIFGLPIGPLQEEQIEGRTFQVQWFERNRLELHPENARPYDVLLGRLGVDELVQQGRDWFTFPKSTPQTDCRFFPETSHNVCGAILAAWKASGLELDAGQGISEAESLGLFGLPLSDTQTEIIDGKEYTIQWFERARFELHPENAPPYDVLLGLLGNEVRPTPQDPLREIFVQVGGGVAFVWMYEPGALTTGFVEAVGCRHSGSYGLQLAYDFSEAGNGGWGVHWADTPTKQFDASKYTTLTFWIKGESPSGFHIGLKDITKKEVKLEAREIVDVSNTEWKMIAIPLSQFFDSDGPVNTASIENFSFSFNEYHGLGGICIDDIAFQ